MKLQYKLFGSFIQLLVIGVYTLLIGVAEAQQAGSLKGQMQEVYSVFKQLNHYILNEKEFVDEKNSKIISELLLKLNSDFYQVENGSHPQKDDPGYVATLQVLNAMLSDAANRFAEGRKEYALWRLKTAANHCMTCHTRFEVSTDFYDAGVNLSAMSPFERGDFLLATRQFEAAGESFMQAARVKSPPYSRLDALRKWLIVYVRVHPDPTKAINQLNQLAHDVSLNAHEREVLSEWLGSFKRWRKEAHTKIAPLVKAENLIRQGLGMNDLLSGKQGTVELLRASALLHTSLDSGVAARARSKALYLLGLTYSKLPLYFVNDLPEMYLEQCIREFPGTDYAKDSYRLYRDILTLGYTGSSGTHLPDDILLIFGELHDLAYGVKAVRDRL